MILKFNIFDEISIYNHFWNWNQSFNNTPLIYAERESHTEIVSQLLSQPNIDINKPSISIPKKYFRNNPSTGNLPQGIVKIWQDILSLKFLFVLFNIEQK